MGGWEQTSSSSCGREDRRYMPFSAASHTGRSPKVSSSLLLSAPEKITTSVFGSSAKSLMLSWTVGATVVSAYSIGTNHLNHP